MGEKNSLLLPVRLLYIPNSCHKTPTNYFHKKCINRKKENQSTMPALKRRFHKKLNGLIPYVKDTMPQVRFEDRMYKKMKGSLILIFIRIFYKHTIVQIT
jgi:hypothetical protein